MFNEFFIRMKPLTAHIENMDEFHWTKIAGNKSKWYMISFIELK